MQPKELIEKLQKQHGLSTDAAISSLLGLTPGRISQLRKAKTDLTARQIASLIQKVDDRSRRRAAAEAICPAVELYPIEKTSSKQDAKWELLPTGNGSPRNQKIREYLEARKGIYILYNSEGCAIYVGKTEKQNIWKEMTEAFNRERSNHQAFVVAHPTTGKSFAPAWQSKKQPKKSVVYLHDTAHYFSAYEVLPEFVAKIEAFLVRAFCNSLSNKKMEKL